MKRMSMGAAAVALIVAGSAHADELADAKARVAAATQKAGKWDGPTTGPRICSSR